MLGRGFIRWTQNQVSRLREAVRAFNATVTKMVNSGKYDVVPNKVNLEKEMGRITTRDQLYQRERELRRILKKNRKDAQEVVEIDGVKMPRYLPREYKNATRSVNRQRAELRETIAPGIGEMSKPEQAYYYANRNLIDLPTVPQNPADMADMYDEFIDEKYFTDILYFDNYMDALKKNFPTIADEIEQIILKLQENPRALRQVMESPDIEKEIDYLYPDRDLTKYEEKQRNLMRYWEGVSKRYAL